MSGCNQDDNLCNSFSINICKHGVNPATQQCHLCGMEHRINLFENQIKLRIEKLEGYIQMEDRVSASDVLMRLTELERFQDITHLQYVNKKKPHKCPICNGIGFNIESEEMMSVAERECNRCDGTGILWN